MVLLAFGYGALGLGVAVCLLNLYLSFVRVPLLRLMGRPARWKSGLPGIGNLLLMLAIPLLSGHSRLITVAVLFALADPGGFLWFAISMARQRRRR